MNGGLGMHTSQNNMHTSQNNIIIDHDSFCWKNVSSPSIVVLLVHVFDLFSRDMTIT